MVQYGHPIWTGMVIDSFTLRDTWTLEYKGRVTKAYWSIVRFQDSVSEPIFSNLTSCGQDGGLKRKRPLI